MPPKLKFSREKVVKAALSVVDQLGLSSLTARNVAIKLGSSTAPVYSHFKTMDELARAVIMEIKRQLLDYTTRPYTDRVFLNMGTGIGMFAFEHRLLYRALMLEGNSHSDVVHEILEILESDMTKDPRFTTLPTGDRHVLLTKMWTFTHGLASMICVGLIKDCDQAFITKALLEMGTDVIGATLTRHKNSSQGK